MRQLHALFLVLHDSSIVRLEYADDKPPSPAACSSAAAAGCADSDSAVMAEAASIFGWSRVYVKDLTRFNARVRDMVEADVFKCWHANGRPTLRQPTNAVYEVLRSVPPAPSHHQLLCLPACLPVPASAVCCCVSTHVIELSLPLSHPAPSLTLPPATDAGK
jgi:hypothetical protein